jgi:hypothetical protein
VIKFITVRMDEEEASGEGQGDPRHKVKRSTPIARHAAQLPT